MVATNYPRHAARPPRANGYTKLVGELERTRNRGLVLLGLLNGADIATTTIALSRGRVEANPLMVPIAHDLLALLLVKFVVVAVITAMALKAPARRAAPAVSLLVGVYIAVVLANVLAIVR